jgi:HlyD family secretion protein
MPASIPVRSAAVRRRRVPWLRVGVMALGLAGAGGGGLAWVRHAGAVRLPEGTPVGTVQRVALDQTVMEDGEVDASEKTLIECDLKRLSFRNGGGSLQASGASLIIDLTPEGTRVSKGDVLCRLDSSEYEEMVRQQEIELQEDRAQYEGARLDLETLEVALKEYRDGQYVQLREQAQAQITLAEADRKRQEDRLDWARRMAGIGYLPLDRLTAEVQTLQRTQVMLDQAKLAASTLVAYKAPKTILTLQGRIDGARAQLTFHEIRVRRDEEQLDEYREQVELCTIRAPHDGVLIYAKDDDDAPIEPGARVREDQDLFYLPDLGRMEVHAKLHETVLDRVQIGQPAQVRIEALPHVLLEGEVVSIAPLPIAPRSWRQSDEIKNYLAKVQLHVVPEGLMPGMSARVQILTGRTAEALVIPPQAASSHEGKAVCYVATPRGVERRPIVAGKSRPEALEVLAGVAEGETVLLDPNHLPEGLPVLDVDRTATAAPVTGGSSEGPTTTAG